MMTLKIKQGYTAKRRAKLWYFIFGIIICLALLASGEKIISYTSSDKYCMSCHVHPVPEQNWKLSTHYNNKSGTIVHCVQCHLPPKSHGYLYGKAKHGLKDAYGYYLKDSASINWEEKKLLEKAKGYVYEQSCVVCHQNLFPVTLSVNGNNAHLFYSISKEKLNCINCHLNVGHYDKYLKHERNTSFGVTETSPTVLFKEPAKISGFENFTEQIPGTNVSFDMITVPEGSFNMGSPENEPLRKPDEGPVHKVTVSGFWMGKVEVTWDEYMAFFKATSSQGRTEGQVVKKKNVDAVSGATPPWGAPDQGWGKGQRPAITMTWYAANVYCQWLSKVTGKKYRLPTEAEWEFACRGGSNTPYFFKGNPAKFTSEGFLKKIFRPDTSIITQYVVYKVNSSSKTEEPSFVKSNPLGIKNMLGNVAEFCSDFYQPHTYKIDSLGNVNPRGPFTGTERVIRGGSFKSDARDVRSASRGSTRTQTWLVTDPQMPKSIWWYSDCIDVGFRVVCEKDSTIH